MTRFASLGLVALSSVFSAACAAGAAAPRTSAGGSKQEQCTGIAQPDVSAATVQRLERASSLLEYESIWRDAQAGAVTGTVGGSDVRARIRAHAPEVHSCYEAAFALLPAGRGRVVVRFVIDAQGHVPAVNVSSNDMGVPEVSCCVAKRVARWSFEPPANGGFVVVEYPFVVHTSKQ